MEQKRSYRRDTVVVALPASVNIRKTALISERGEIGGDGNGAGRAQIEATRNGARPAPLTIYSRPEVRKREIGSVTCIG